MKVAASPRIYMGRCPKIVFKSPVTSHSVLIPAFKLVMATLSRIVIPSAAEGPFLHCGQYHIGTGKETMSCYYVYLRSHRRRLSVCKEDFSLTLEMTMRESDVS